MSEDSFENYLVPCVTHHFQLFYPIRKMKQETNLKGPINGTYVVWEFDLWSINAEYLEALDWSSLN